MNENCLRVLMVEDNPDDADLLVFRLECEGFRPQWTRVDSARDFDEQLNACPPPEIVLSDWAIPGFGGAQALEIFNKRALDIPFIVISGKIGEETVADILRRGVYDYVSKDNLVRAGQAVKNALVAAHQKKTALRAEDALRTSEANFRAFFSSVQEMVLISTPAGQILDSNPTASKKLGYSPEELGKLGIPHLYSGEQREKAGEAFSALLRGERNACSLPVQSKEGTLVPVEMSVSTGTWNGEPAVFTLLRDQTAEQEAQHRFETLFRNNPALMALSSTMDRRFVDVNETWLKTLGYNRAEVIGKTSTELGLFIKPEIAQSLGSRLTMDKRFSDIELRIKAKDGKILDGLFSGEVITFQGMRYFLTVMLDITERKKADNAMRKSQHAFAEINTCLVNLGHDYLENINTLTALCGKLLGAACALYIRLENGLLRSLGQWQVPAGYISVDRPEGHLCYDVIRQGKGQVTVVRNLPATGYHQSDPNVRQFGLLTYAGHCVHSGDEPVGALCVVYKCDMELDTQDLGVLSIIASAIAHEEQQLLNNRLITESNQKYTAFMEATQDAVFLKTATGRFVMVNKAAEKYYGHPGSSIIGKVVDDFMPADTARLCRESDLKALLGKGIVTSHEHYRGRVFEIRKFPIIHGNEVMIGGYIRDVTEAHLAERELEIEVKVNAIIRERQTRSGIIEDTLVLLRSFPDTIDAFFEISSDEAEPLNDESVSDQDENSETTLHLPLTSQGRSIGMFILKRTAEPDAEDLDLLLLISRLVANAINVVDLRTETRDRLDKLNALALIDESISSDTDLQTTLRVVLDQAVALLKADAAAIFLLDETQTMLKLAVATGFRQPRASGEAIPLGQPYIGMAATERRTIFVKDFSGLDPDSRFARIVKEEGFSSYLCAPMIIKAKLLGAIGIYPRGEFRSDTHLVPFFESIARQAAIAIENKTLYRNEQKAREDLVAAYDATIEGWSRAMDLRDKETEGHSRRVKELAIELARRLGMSGENLTNIRRGALLHDIGKVAIPDGVLLKPGPLSDEEWVVMKKHPSFAHEMLSPIEYLRPSLDIPYCHHEKWDGTGYPRGLAGEDIPLPARIFAVVDVWDALTSDRPYRKAWTSERARSYIAGEAGRHFDPEVASAFLDMLDPGRVG